MRSGDLHEPITLIKGEEWVFTIQEGANGTDRRISVNYDGFVDDVSVGDQMLVDGGICSFEITRMEGPDVICKARSCEGWELARAAAERSQRDVSGEPAADARVRRWSTAAPWAAGAT